MHRFLVLTALLVPSPLSAQSLLYRSPNLGGTWTADAGVVQFNFLHRFYISPGPVRAVNNFPTFAVAAGVGHQAMIGWHFATKGIPVASASSTNESELFARWRVLGRAEGRPGLGLSVTPAYNLHAESFDGEVSADYTVGRLTLLGSARAMSKPLGASGGAKAALAGGAIVRLNDYVALSGDYGKLLSGDSTAAWSAGISFVIPGSPHTFSLQVSNVGSNTIQGSSVGLAGTPQRLYGFEFTIPLHLGRFSPWFKKSADAAGGASVRVAEPGVTEIRISGFKFAETVTISAGQSVRWVNADPVDHTITFESAAMSSALIKQGTAYTYTFDRPGTYTYHCTPHPFMKGTIVVR